MENLGELYTEGIKDLDIAKLRKCHYLIQGLFSINEAIEEVATGDLRFLCLDYYYAEALSLMPNRLDALNQASAIFKDWLQLLECYGFEVKRKTGDKRQVKIENYKKQKLLEAELAQCNGSDELRDYYLKHVELLICKTMDHLDCIEMELELLKNRPDDILLPPQPVPPKPTTGPLLDKNGKVNLANLAAALFCNYESKRYRKNSL
jgi:hypothetical protein